MQEKNLNTKIIKATKWSASTEIIARLIGPITNMILARILAPEAFGVVATITMVVSFADMFTDAGFQKYLIQCEFEDEDDKEKSTNVAFWTNLVISLILWLVIVLLADKIATMVGIPELGNVIAIASMQLPLTSFSSIQMAVYRREFNFKTLFYIRMIGICIPFIITIPLAVLGYSYWALIIGSICGTLFNAIILTVRSKWKPKCFFRFSILKDMISFSIWSLVEAISIWLTTWVDSFIIGSVLNTYYLGVYKNSLTTVNGIFGLITGSTTSILFVALSRTQNDNTQFNNIFFSMQKMVSYLVLPMSIGMFVYSDLVVQIFLGDTWIEASEVVGIWALMSGIVIVLGHYSSEVYRAKGRPKLSFWAQMLHLIVLIPVCIIASKQSFLTLVNARAIIRLQAILVHMIFLQFIMEIPVKTILKNITVPGICAILMGAIGMIIRDVDVGFGWDLISILICIVCYFILLLCFKSSRQDIIMIIDKFNIRNRLRKLELFNRHIEKRESK